MYKIYYNNFNQMGASINNHPLMYSFDESHSPLEYIKKYYDNSPLAQNLNNEYRSFKLFGYEIILTKYHTNSFSRSSSSRSP